jgi:hypothetical protein
MPEHLTISDMEELYRVDIGSTQAASFLEKAREKGLWVLEIDPSYRTVRSHGSLASVDITVI